MPYKQACQLILVSTFMIVATSCARTATDPGPGNRVMFDIGSAEYRSGDTVTITAVNLTSVQLTYPGGFCPQVLQRSENGEWIAAEEPNPQASCSFSIGYLGPSEEIPLSHALPADVPTGVYRILLPTPTVDINNPALAEPPTPTRSFTVTSDPQ